MQTMFDEVDGDPMADPFDVFTINELYDMGYIDDAVMEALATPFEEPELEQAA